MPFATTDDGVRLHYEESGRGTPLIFVHEFAGDSRSYEGQLRHFGKRFHAIAFNARGFPPSDVPPDVSAYSQGRAADDILTILDHVSAPKAHVAGISMGGFATLHFGLRHHERALSLCITARLALAALFVTCAAGAARAEDAASIAWPEPGGRATISRAFAGSDIAVSVSSRTAGAIDSLTWGGTQFINAYDHGRELQSAASYDGYGECLNPTEAGSDADATGPRSTSLLTALRVGPDTLQTRSQMAYFMAPGRPVGDCPKGPGPYAAPRSDDGLSKRVTLGAAGIANAIEYRVTFTTARVHASATFEAATAYMPPDFSRFESFDPATGRAAPLSAGPGEQGVPVILSNADGSRAMGVYSPGLPQASVPNAGYGRFSFTELPGAGNATVKWNCVFRETGVPAGDHGYACYALVGTLRDVQDGMVALRAALTGQAAPAARLTARAGVPGVALYVGTQGGCNAGEVTIDPGDKGCATAPVG